MGQLQYGYSNFGVAVDTLEQSNTVFEQCNNCIDRVLTCVVRLLTSLSALELRQLITHRQTYLCSTVTGTELLVEEVTVDRIDGLQ